MNFPSILIPLVGLVFPAIAMASLFLHIQKKTIS
uniref:Photosystem I reaction center subunit VIII n=1 Tax=Grona heterocarpos TaxID=499991 RepID=A0A510BUV7_9FABA|nr:photosystem I subunit VIII [Grona heterocarpos]YP_009747425.1 photosystem I subunit VIII [Grona styracifolia]AYA54416.1 photosystem I subunit VIII [Grona heterocarpos]QII68588.1 photosystem I subunit VIII [Grona styracifolia]